MRESERESYVCFSFERRKISLFNLFSIRFGINRHLAYSNKTFFNDCCIIKKEIRMERV